MNAGKPKFKSTLQQVNQAELKRKAEIQMKRKIREQMYKGHKLSSVIGSIVSQSANRFKWLIMALKLRFKDLKNYGQIKFVVDLEGTTPKSQQSQYLARIQFIHTWVINQWSEYYFWIFLFDFIVFFLFKFWCY